MRNWLIALTAILATGALTSSAAAQGVGCYGGYGGFGLGLMYNSLDYRVPYFAAHPPVYYSYPVPRTYGHSPFAYPPHFRTPELVEESAPLTITNPYVPTSSTKPAAPIDETVEASKKAVEPLMVHNPYFTDGPPVVHAAF